AHTSAAQFHVQQLSRLLQPTLTTRACIHAILQDHRAHGGEGAGGKDQGAASSGMGPAPPEAGTRVHSGRAETSSRVLQDSCDRRGGGDGVSRGAVDGGSAKQGTPGNLEAEGIGGEEDIWSQLMGALEATEEQKAAMRSQVSAMAELAEDLQGTLGVMRRLEALLVDRNQTLEGEMTEIQTAKFVLWVTRNTACVHMLNQLWEHVHGGVGGR
ncbi:unnamed protein product, partial [Discosporangium mesarthrocarpum]